MCGEIHDEGSNSKTANKLALANPQNGNTEDSKETATTAAGNDTQVRSTKYPIRREETRSSPILREAETRNTVITAAVILRYTEAEFFRNPVIPGYKEFKPKARHNEASNAEIFLT
jgi:hypothetical protein